MFPFSFESIDWSRPFFASLGAAAEAMRVAGGGFTGLNQCSAQRGLRTHSGMALAFVDQSELPEGVAYEAFIAATGGVPTRANLHDFFNALVWLSFPRIKMQLNAMQAAQIAHDGVGQSRGATRDAVTIFDENAAILVLRDGAQGRDLADALRNHQWHKLFVDRRDCFVVGDGQDAIAEVSLFGHALMEKLCAPYKGITAHTWIVFAPDDFFGKVPSAKREWLDGYVAADLAARDVAEMSTACFTPLPVLGLPEWWPDQDAEFYADASVFRPKRRERR